MVEQRFLYASIVRLGPLHRESEPRVPLPNLPRILTSADLSADVGRSAVNIEKLAARGLFADPTHSCQGAPMWTEPAAFGWFASLHEHAVLVPGDELAAEELRLYGVYMCPLSPDHVGLARPQKVVLYGGGAGEVFSVTAVETVNQNLKGTRATRSSTRRFLRHGTPIGDVSAHPPMTVFFLQPAGSIASIAPGIRKGRYVTITQVDEALNTGRLEAPVLDEAFPVRWSR